MSKVPRLIKQVIREETWRRFETKLGHVVEHDSFEAFVTAEPLSGLGGSVDMLRHLCRDDPEALDLLDQVTRRDHGGDRQSDEFKTHNVQLESSGNNGGRRDKALRKLRTDAPQLHAEVLAGNLTAHAAMIQAGFRRPTMTVPVDPAAVARALRKRFTGGSLFRGPGVGALPAGLAEGPLLPAGGVGGEQRLAAPGLGAPAGGVGHPVVLALAGQVRPVGRWRWGVGVPDGAVAAEQHAALVFALGSPCHALPNQPDV